MFTVLGWHRMNSSLGLLSWYSQSWFDRFYIWFMSCIFILDLPTNIDMWTLYYFFLAGNWVVSSFFDCLGKGGKTWKLKIYDGLWMPRNKERNLLAEIYRFWNLLIMGIRFHKIFIVYEYQLGTVNEYFQLQHFFFPISRWTSIVIVNRSSIKSGINWSKI
jgi:hypothetical protein